MPVSEKHLQELCQLFLKFRSPQEMRKLLEDILTPQEVASVAERWQIIQALLKGLSQREIAERLHTSIGTITRGSRVVQYGNVDWKKVIGK